MAVRLGWLKYVAGLIAAGFGSLFVYAALTENAPESFFMSGIAGMVWGGLLLAFLLTFRHVPPPPHASDSRWQRIKLRIRRWGYGGLAILTIVATIATVWITVKL